MFIFTDPQIEDDIPFLTYIDLTKPPEVYIVCEDRKNHARIWVGICRERCENKDTCREYQAWERENGDKERIA